MTGSVTDPETPNDVPSGDRVPELPENAEPADAADGELEPAFDVDLEPDEQGLAEAASESSG